MQDEKLICTKKNDETEYRHPSFGLISISEVTGGNRALFGSSINHRDTLVIKISHAILSRHLNHDWYHARNLITEIEISKTQWAELLTSLNHGDGVPCTLTFADNENVPSCPEIPKREQFDEEFKESIAKAMTNMHDALNAAEKLLNKKSVTKADKMEIIELIQSAERTVTSGMPFIKTQFDKQMDKTVLEAKSIIESWCLHHAPEKTISELNNILTEGEMKELPTDDIF